MKYVSVIIDNNTNATDELYTYTCSDDNAAVGQKVRVLFGIHNRRAEGYIAFVSDNAPEGIGKFKAVSEILSGGSLPKEIIDTAVWMRNRYMCRFIEAVNCFLPGFTEGSHRIKDPFRDMEIKKEENKELNPGQCLAVKELSLSIREKKHSIYLLNGVTGSGKTEVYIQAMAACIEEGRQGIVLVPEIALTPQTVSRFISRFGREMVAVIHSKLTKAQKAEEFSKIRKGQVKLVIGARSAIFAPFEKIGLIVIDEEHETGYKSDKSPKYDAIELAAKRAMEHKAVLLLGSATPSVTDCYRMRKGIFKPIVLNERYNKNPLPSVSIVDMREEVKAGNKSLFSRTLCSEIYKNIEQKKQIILFLNRRGYSSFVSCRECGYTVKCPDCGISMTYHKGRNALVCHYCGRSCPVPRKCPDCGSEIIGKFGAGTEMVEEKAKELFPEVFIERLDFDTISKKGSLEAALKRFGQGKTDILIGTQLVAKGLDFANVGLVGIINADVTLNIPDFRSSERCFQLVTQAAGRAGRGNERGNVIIQSYTPDNPALEAAALQDYNRFYEREILLRKAAFYPPFSDIFQIVFSSESEEKAEKSAGNFRNMFMEKLNKDIILLGPCSAPIKRAGGLFRYQLLIKADHSLRREVCFVINEIKRIRRDDVLLTSDINPFSML